MTSPSQMERLANVRRAELLTLAGEHHGGEPADRRAASSQLSRTTTRLWLRLLGFLAAVRPRRGHIPVGQLKSGDPQLIRVGQAGPR
jgi:hypothetical protein